ncbi:MAG: DUF4347 domain-containing protein, partial [Chlorobium phaeovibrioides]|nr:DUF4347 domain-containing protein [Chlorobium phaeovibrioides]
MNTYAAVNVISSAVTCFEDVNRVGSLPRSRNLVLADAGLPDLDVLVEQLVPDTTVCFVPRDEKAVPFIEHALNAGYERLHILAHGKPGGVRLGSQLLTAKDFVASVSSLRSSSVLPSLHFWSCSTGAGEKGQAFVAALAKQFGSVVTAFSGLVGAMRLGGGWDPDVSMNQQDAVEVPFLDALAYGYTLQENLLELVPTLINGGVTVGVWLKAGTAIDTADLVFDYTGNVTYTAYESSVSGLTFLANEEENGVILFSGYSLELLQSASDVLLGAFQFTFDDDSTSFVFSIDEESTLDNSALNGDDTSIDLGTLPSLDILNFTLDSGASSTPAVGERYYTFDSGTNGAVISFGDATFHADLYDDSDDSEFTYDIEWDWLDASGDTSSHQSGTLTFTDFSTTPSYTVQFSDGGALVPDGSDADSLPDGFILGDVSAAPVTVDLAWQARDSSTGVVATFNNDGIGFSGSVYDKDNNGDVDWIGGTEGSSPFDNAFSFIDTNNDSVKDAWVFYDTVYPSGRVELDTNGHPEGLYVNLAEAGITMIVLTDTLDTQSGFTYGSDAIDGTAATRSLPAYNTQYNVQPGVKYELTIASLAETNLTVEVTGVTSSDWMADSVSEWCQDSSYSFASTTGTLSTTTDSAGYSVIVLDLSTVGEHTITVKNGAGESLAAETITVTAYQAVDTTADAAPAGLDLAAGD